MRLTSSAAAVDHHVAQIAVEREVRGPRRPRPAKRDQLAAGAGDVQPVGRRVVGDAARRRAHVRRTITPPPASGSSVAMRAAAAQHHVHAAARRPRRRGPARRRRRSATVARSCACARSTNETRSRSGSAATAVLPSRSTSSVPPLTATGGRDGATGVSLKEGCCEGSAKPPPKSGPSNGPSHDARAQVVASAAIQVAWGFDCAQRGGLCMERDFQQFAGRSLSGRSTSSRPVRCRIRAPFPAFDAPLKHVWAVGESTPASTP